MRGGILRILGNTEKSHYRHARMRVHVGMDENEMEFTDATRLRP